LCTKPLSPDAEARPTGSQGIIQDWSPDGRLLLYSWIEDASGNNLWVAPAAAGEGTRVPAASSNSDRAQFSPDGRWIAYSSQRSGTLEVYVQEFPSGSSKRTVSTNGGRWPRWRRDGRELFYISGDGTLTAVTIQAAGTLEVGLPVPLFRTGATRQYDVAPDGQRFLFVEPTEAEQSPLTVVVNWSAGRP
jgi:hypothetical protein